MSIVLREYLGFSQLEKEKGQNASMGLSESLLESPEPIAENSLMVDIEGIHVGPTRNFTRYTEQALKSSVKTWTYPYEKPLIMHHNVQDGKIIGRIKNVYYTDVNTRSGTGALVFTANIPDKEGMDQVRDGRLMTVSIGIIGHDVRCSICEHNIARYGPCEHEKGQEYDGEICYWDVYEMEGKELSYVIVPSDIYAKNIKIYKPNAENKKDITESMNNEKEVLNLGLSEKDVLQLKKELEELKKEKEKFESVKNELKEKEKGLEEAKDKLKELDQLKEENEELKTKLQEAEERIKELSELEEKLKSAKQELKREQGLRESFESKSIELKNTSKQLLIENYTMLRKLTGKSDIPMEEMQQRTYESLQDSIKDLKEELKNSGMTIDTLSIQPVFNPTLAEKESHSVKKQKKVSNIDLEEEVENLFNHVASRFSRK